MEVGLTVEFLEAVGKRRTVRFFKSWEPVERSKVQEILEVVRLSTCPGNIQPWRAIVVYRDEIDEDLRDELLKADNWQGGHTQAPVWIYFYGDPDACRSEFFVRSTMQLCEVGAMPPAYGWTKERIVNAIERAEETPDGMASINELLHDIPAEQCEAMAYAETVGACGVATLAAVNAGLSAALNMIAKPTAQDRVKELLGAPASWVPVWMLLVGHSAEGPEAGGQRPRHDFGSLFFDAKVGNPLPRDEKVVEKLKQQGLIQAPAPLPWRATELSFLARMYGYPEDPGA